MTFFILKLIGGGVLLALSALFSVAETAFLSLSPLQLGRLSRAHPGRLDFWQKDPDRVLAAILFGNNLVNVGLGVLATSLAFDLDRAGTLDFRWGGWVIPLSVATLVIVVGEIFPKTWARFFPEFFAVVLARPTRWLSGALGPVLEGLVSATGRFLETLSGRFKTGHAQWSAPVIRRLLANAAVARPLRSVLDNLLNFAQLPVARVMVPRDAIFSVDLTLPRDQFIRRILDAGYSRVPVHRGSLDKVEGVVYAKDLLSFRRSEALIVLEDLVRPVTRVAPEIQVSRLLRHFRQGHNHMALVVDAADRVQGLVTLEDSLSAIVGPMPEEPEPSVA